MAIVWVTARTNTMWRPTPATTPAARHLGSRRQQATKASITIAAAANAAGTGFAPSAPKAAGRFSAITRPDRKSALIFEAAAKA